MTNGLRVEEEPAIDKVLRDGVGTAAPVCPGDATKFFRLGDIARTASGGTPRRDRPDFYGGSIPWVKSGELRDGIVLATEEAITEAAIEGSSAKVFPKGTVCVALYGATVGRVGVLGLDAATNQAVCGIFPSDRLRAEYLRYFLFASRRLLVESSKGGAQPNVSQQIVRELRIPLPSTARQREIVAYLDEQLSRLDASVAALHRVQANLKRYRASVLKTACEGRLVPTEAELARQQGRNFETGTQLLQRVLAERLARASGKQKEPIVADTVLLPSLPTGWTWASLGQIGMVVSGLTKNPKREKLEPKLPYLRVANVYADELRLSEIELIGVGDAELEKLLVLKDDLLVVEGNGSPDQIGRVALWDGSISPCVHQNHLIKVRLHSVNARWAMNWLLSPQGRNQIEQASSSTSGLHTLSTGKVARLTIPLPPLAEQHRIVAEADRRLSLVRVAEAQVVANLARAHRLRQSILQAAFTMPAQAGQ